MQVLCYVVNKSHKKAKTYNELNLVKLESIERRTKALLVLFFS